MYVHEQADSPYDHLVLQLSIYVLSIYLRTYLPSSGASRGWSGAPLFFSISFSSVDEELEEAVEKTTTIVWCCSCSCLMTVWQRDDDNGKETAWW